MTANKPTSIPWPPFLFLAAYTLAWLLTRVYPLAWPGLDDAPARFIGWGFGILGLFLIIAAVISLRQHKTTVRPDQASKALVTTGPYRYLRNPIYLGEVFIFFGLAELSKSIWFIGAGLMFATAVTWLSILPEESHLEHQFGDDYLTYKAKTRRWI